jgi:hypothetical protein
MHLPDLSTLEMLAVAWPVYQLARAACCGCCGPDAAVTAGRTVSATTPRRLMKILGSGPAASAAGPDSSCGDG